MSNTKTVMYVAGVLIGALSLYGVYRATQHGESTSSAPATAGSAGTTVAPVVGDAAMEPRGSADTGLRLLDAASANITQASVTGGQCWLDYFEQDGKAVTGDIVANGLPTQFYGWGVTDALTPATRMLIELKSKDGAPEGGFIPVDANVTREDIAKAKGSDSYKQVGFYRTGELMGVPVGKYHLYLVIDSDGALTQCDLNREINVQ